MTNRERVLKILSGEPPDRVPWFADLDYWYSAHKRAGTLPDEYQGDGYFSMNRENGAGFYLQGYFPFKEIPEGVTYETQTQGHRILRAMKTPEGDLTEITQYLPASSSTGFVKHFVETEEDLPAFQYYINSLHFEEDYIEARRRKDLIGDNGVVLCYTPRSPFMQMLTTFAGVEALFMMLADIPEKVNEVLSRLEKKYDEAARLAVNSPAELIMIPENLSGEVAGGYYKTYLRPYESKWIAEIQKAGKKSLIHVDGTLRGILQKVAETGFNVIEAVTPAPVGDMTMEEAARAAPGTILWGGLPGLMFTPHVSEDAFIRHVRSVLAVMKTEPRFVLGAADQVPPDGMMERVKAVPALCEEFGKY